MPNLPDFCPIPYGRQDIQAEDLAAISEILQSDYLTQGPRIAAFEAAFASYVGASSAAAVSSGTAALHLCALALGVQPGHKVITTPLTFAASANCVRYCGGEVVLADVDPATALLDINAVRKILEAAPKGSYHGIIPVDFMGLPVQMAAFRELADEFGLWIIEDSCHAPGAEFQAPDGQWHRCGSGEFADLAIFSFHPVKHIACGEGGMVTSRRPELIEHIQRLRQHGITKSPDLLEENHGGWYYEMQELGYNYRLSDLHAGLGLSQLPRAAANLNRRREIARRYDEAFTGTSARAFLPQSWQRHAYHLYVVQVPKRKAVYDGLREAGIYSQVHYIPLHYLPYYQRLGFQKGDFPQAEAYYEGCLSLPMYPTLSDVQQRYVIEQVLKLVQS